MRRILAFMVAAMLGGVALVMLAASPVAAADLDCKDFITQDAAQAYLDANPGDPDGLDADGDGVACESLPQASELESDSAQTGGVTDSGSSHSTGGVSSSGGTAAVVAASVDDQNCGDFPNQAAAQAHLNADRSDPDNLDGDNDGQACEGFFGTSSASSSTSDSGARVVPVAVRAASTPRPAAVANTGAPSMTVTLLATAFALLGAGILLVRYGHRRDELQPAHIVLRQLYDR